ncbi:MAG TPA: acetyl-CoA carboxylase carboxyltransferase subunit alpha [Candidatus Acidoferrales bacterium]|jgi:acetyl-CoA carboxylase carboxyl transferase subunit alpha|nr:acetyl-CoA carboxylase carboxyltransferase subunit alpha [Candidatus Acidoferrales bacterium]
MSKRQEIRERLRRRRELAKLRKQEAKTQKSEAPSQIETPETARPAVVSVKKEIDRQRQREIDALERDVADLTRLSAPTGETKVEIERIRREVDELKRDFYTHLDAWQRLQLARHPQRPYTDDFIRLLFENFSEIHGDRNFSDDPALITGMATFHGMPVMIVGNQKGRDTKQRLARNFGQAKPEGYRKALRAMKLAAKFRRPIFIFVDTQGAYPGVDAEERGQAEAIAFNLREMSRLPVPIVVTITGEGGSGGALAIAIGDRVYMLENSVYSVISPEGCASIMWRDPSKAEVAAEALKITAPDLLEMKLIDEIVPEPDGGAHNDHAATAKLLEPVLARSLDELSQLSPQALIEQRYQKFRQMGQFFA